MKQLQGAWPLVLLFSAIAAGISAKALPGTLLCMIVVLWFLLVCPGMAVVCHLNLKEPQAEWPLAIALSLALDAMVASIELYAGVWFPPGILGILITLCVVGAIAPFVLTCLASLTRTGRTGRKARSLAAAFFFLVLVVPISGLGVWSYRMRTHVATTASAAANQAPQPTSPAATSPGGTVIDTVMVMDNVDHITAYDPQDDRYKAAQLFANMLPLGSSVGIVRITSTQDPVLMLAMQALHTGSDRAMILNTLTANTFGSVDPTSVAYFNPALQMADTMLRARPPTDRKLIVIFTDALAVSGDHNPCANSPDAYHTWFCTAGLLEQQGITIALVGFTPPGGTATLRPVQQFLAARGGITVPVSDGPNLAAQLTAPYSTLLKAVGEMICA